MPRRAIGARRLEQSLIVIEAHRLRAQQLRSDRGPAFVEHDATGGIAHAPDIRNLREQLRVVVDPALRVAPRSDFGDDLLDYGTGRSDLIAARDSANERMTVSA